MNESELGFLVKKELKERNQYFRVYEMLMLLSFIIPYAGAWYRAYDGAPNAFSTPKFFFTAGILLSICTFATYMTYRINLRKIQLDIKFRTKTIEITHILRKQQVNIQNTYYFYIDSRIKLTIEVSYDDYVRMDEGDEVCIEYATNSKQYFGYF